MSLAFTILLERASYYDGLGRIVKVINPDGTYTQTKYHDGQNKKIEINEELAEQILYYDKIGNIIGVELKNGPTTYTNSYDYDYTGNLIYQKDSKGYETYFLYDELNRLTEVINPVNEKTSYEYDNLSNITKIIQQEYDSTGQLNTEILSQKEYDELGRIIKATDPLNKSEFFKYDRASNLIHKKDKNNQTITYTYDNRNRLLTQRAADHIGIVDNETIYDYSQLYNQNLLTVNHNGRITTYEYNSNGSLKKEEIQPDNQITQYEYDENGNRSKMTDPFGLTVDYQYDSRNRLDILKINNQKTFDYDYYADGMMESIQYPTAAITSNFNYDALNRLTVLNNGYGSLNDTYSYQYNGNNNLTSITENTITSNYDYDQLNRLQLIDRPDTNQQTTYSYDARGNRTKMEGYISSPYIITEMDIDRHYTYNTLNQLVQFTAQDNTLNAYYQYDHKGLRTEKTIPEGTTKYYYDNTGRTITETDDSGTLKAQVVWGHKPLVRIIDGQYYYYLYNGHGDVVQIVDESGNIVNRYSYDEWGNILEKEETIENPIRYAGEYYDEESGLYYLRARYYDPTIGRFITRDSYEGQLTNPLRLNQYTFCVNNPLIFVDPTGNDAEDTNRIYKATPEAEELITVVEIVDTVTDIAAPQKFVVKKVGKAAIKKLVLKVGKELVKEFVTDAAKKAVAEGTLKSIPDIIPNKGFSTFSDLKNYLGSPEEGNAWHHFVEQSQIGKRANFTSSQVNNVNNVISIPHGNGSIHSKISAHYSSKFDFTRGQTVRDWLATQSFEEQFKYGKELLEEFGTVTATKNGWVFEAFELEE